MPLSMLFKKSDCIPIEYMAVKTDSPYQRLYSSYLNDQPADYSSIKTDSSIKFIFNERDVSEDDLNLCFEIDHERAKNYLLVEMPVRLYSQKINIPNSFDIYKAEAVCEDGILEITIPVK
ncbi:MAG: Hsp20 family protein [Lentisphaeraceae bacterium]|nr:Hsp20 family protein [Lentisphaeraceae bacterium]